jgi:hypothetical protein
MLSFAYTLFLDSPGLHRHHPDPASSRQQDALALAFPEVERRQKNTMIPVTMARSSVRNWKLSGRGRI